ncbi:MAG TPA: clostripain-related cysteine peptidase, partial [Pseudolysinimonas sp.]
TNLEYFQMEDMAEQEVVGSRPGFSLISYLDRSDDYSEDPVIGIPNWAGAKIIEVKQDGGSVVKSDEGEVNTGDPAVLAGFIEYAVTNYPAAHYALILNDHGSSWPGVGADGSADNDQLTLAEIHQGIADGLAGGGIDKLDMIGFDACLMATYETASTMQDVADRMVASQELEPGYGWNYTALETAARGGTVDELADAIITAFGEQSTQQGEAQVTLSETDLTKMADVDAAVSAFAQALIDRVDGIGPTVGRSLAENLGFGSTPDYDFYMTDLAMLAGQISVDATDVADEADALTKAINDAVINKVDGQATRGATGMAIYFPPQADAFSDKYTEVDAASHWTDFLKTYYTAGQASSEKPKFSSGQAQSDFANGGFVIGQQVTSDLNQITDVYISYGYVESDGSVTLVGDESANIDTDGFASGFFDTYQLWIGDGANETSFYSTYDVNQESDVATVGVPIAYFLPGAGTGSQAFLQMSYAPSTGTILSETFYGQDESGAYAEIAPEAGSTFAPLKISIANDGSRKYFLSSDVYLSADPDALSFDYRKLDSGTLLYAELVIQNSAGETDTSAATGTLP